MSEVRVNKLSPRSGTTVTLGDSGDTITIPSGVTLANSGTIDNLNASNLTSGTVPDARITGAYTGITNLTMTGDLTINDGNKIQLTKNTVSSGDSLGIIEFHDEDGATGANAGEFRIEATRGDDKDSPNLKFIGAGTTGVLEDRLVIAGSSGNVGIGTSSPASELEIEATTPEIRIDATSGAGRNYKIHSDGDELYLEGIGSSGSLKIGEDGTYGVSIDLGTGGIQVSDGIYLGGTGTANKLEDYEEGTFTPSFSSGNGFGNLSYVFQRGVYTKIGRIVNVRIQIELGSGVTKNGNRVIMDGLPFTSSSALPGTGFNWSYVNSKVIGSTTTNIPILWVTSSNNSIQWYKTDGSDFTGNDTSGSTTNMDIYINGTYQTDA